MTVDPSVLDKLNSRLSEIGGCSNHGCRILKPKGMGTNGPCRCLDNRITATRVVMAYKEFVHEVTK